VAWGYLAWPLLFRRGPCAVHERCVVTIYLGCAGEPCRATSVLLTLASSSAFDGLLLWRLDLVEFFDSLIVLVVGYPLTPLYVTFVFVEDWDELKLILLR
jgi:hypothetical protein